MSTVHPSWPLSTHPELSDQRLVAPAPVGALQERANLHEAIMTHSCVTIGAKTSRTGSTSHA